MSLLLAHRDMLHCGSRASLTGHCGHGWTCSLPRQVAMDTREPPVGALKKGLLRVRLSAIIMSSRLPASHPDCRAVLTQIVARHPQAYLRDVLIEIVATSEGAQMR